MTKFIDMRVGVNDDEFAAFLAKLASSVASIGVRDEDGEELSLEPTGDTDKTGVPWLESVHAGTKNQTKDKRWKRKQGVTEAERDAAEAAWRAANQVAAPAVNTGTVPITATPTTAPVMIPGTAAPAAAPAPGVAIPGMAAPAAAPAAGVTIPGMAPAAAPAPIVPAVQPDIPASIEDVGNAFSALSAVYKFDDAFVAQIYTAAGITDPQEMMTNETARRSVIKTINATIESIPKA